MQYHYYKQAATTGVRRLLSVTSAAVIVLSSFSFMLATLLTNNAAALTSYTSVPFTQGELDSNWITDRAEPSGGHGSVNFDGRTDVLEMSIDNTSPHPTGGFYLTEGIKSSVGMNDAIKADLYVDSDWETKPVRAGMWGVGYDAGNAISAYPIIEYASNISGYTGWRIYNVITGAWINQPGVPYNTGGWNTVEISLNKTSGLIDYYINGDHVQSTLSGGTVSIKEVIFNNYNSATTSADDYDVRWSEFALGAYTPDIQTIETVNVYGDTAAGENQPGWLFNRDTSTMTPYEFNTDEASIGNGSLYIEPITNTLNGNSDKFIAEYFMLTPMAEVNDITYDFMIGAGGNVNDDNEFYMNVYANFGSSDATKFYDCRYNVVPQLGSNSTFTTVTFDPNQSYPVATRGSSPHTCPNIPAEMDTLSTGSTLRVFALNVGDSSANDTGLDGYFDNVVVNTLNSVTTYDFEPDTTAPDFTANLSDTTIGVNSGEPILNGVITDTETNVSKVNHAIWARNTNGSKGAVIRNWTNLPAADGSYDEMTEEINTELNITGLAEGSYILGVRGYDDASNKTSGGDFVFTVDNTKPNVNVVVPATGDVRGANFTVKGAASDEATDIDKVLYTVTEVDAIGGTYVDSVTSGTATYDSVGDEFNFDLNSLTSGFYRIKVQAFDNAGNWKYDYNDVEVDTTAPVASIVDPADGDHVSGSVLLIGEVTDDNPKNSYFRIEGPSGYVQTSLFTDGRSSHEYNWDTTGLIEGDYTIYFETRDSLGNKDGTRSAPGDSVVKIVVTVDNTAPAVDAGDDKTVTDALTTALEGVATDASGVTVEWTGPLGVTITDPADLNTDVTVPAYGQYTFILNVTDAAGNVSSDSVTITFEKTPQILPANNTNTPSENNNQAPNNLSNQAQGNRGLANANQQVGQNQGNQDNDNQDVLASTTDSQGDENQGQEQNPAEGFASVKSGLNFSWWWLGVPTLLIVGIAVSKSIFGSFLE